MNFRFHGRLAVANKITMLVRSLGPNSYVAQEEGRWKGVGVRGGEGNGKLKLRGDGVVGDKGIPTIAVNSKERLICLNYYRLTSASLTFNYDRGRTRDRAYVPFVLCACFGRRK